MKIFLPKPLLFALSILLLVVFLGGYPPLDKATAQSTNPLPSWNDASAKQAIVEFTQAVPP